MAGWIGPRRQQRAERDDGHAQPFGRGGRLAGNGDGQDRGDSGRIAMMAVATPEPDATRNWPTVAPFPRAEKMSARRHTGCDDINRFSASV
jgi:hypothetical protein